MSLPRGQESGAEYSVLLVLSPLLPGDTGGAAWARLDQQSWAWCGVRKDRGGMPDSRYGLYTVLVCPVLSVFLYQAYGLPTRQATTWWELEQPPVQ